jgi:hypothetical protein
MKIQPGAKRQLRQREDLQRVAPVLLARQQAKRGG